jgi:hypothetical protein
MGFLLAVALGTKDGDRTIKVPDLAAVDRHQPLGEPLGNLVNPSILVNLILEFAKGFIVRRTA